MTWWGGSASCPRVWPRWAQQSGWGFTPLSHLHCQRDTGLQSAWPVPPSTHPSLHSLVACLPRERGVTQQPGGTGEATGQPSCHPGRYAKPTPLCPLSLLNLHQSTASLPLCSPFSHQLGMRPLSSTGPPQSRLPLWLLFAFLYPSLQRLDWGDGVWRYGHFTPLWPTSQPTWHRETIAQYSLCLNPELNGGSKKHMSPRTYECVHIWVGVGGHFADAIQLRISRWDHSGLEWALTAKTSILIKEKGRHKWEGHVARETENGMTWP